MLQTSECQVKQVSVHWAGNKHQGESLALSGSPLLISDPVLSEILQHYFLDHFSSPEYFSFKTTDDDGAENPLYHLAKAVFNDSGTDFHEASKKIAELLYNCSDHPNIKPGELFVVFVQDIVMEDELTDAIGIFKAETKQAFLKTNNDGGNVMVEYSHGTNTDKLDKACLIVNTNEMGGYKLCVIDKTNRAEEARFWKDAFLQVKPCADNYHFTEAFMKATKKFVTSKAMDKDFDLEKADKLEMLNSSVQYFRDNETFNEIDYANQVFKDEKIAHSFQEFRREYQEKNDLPPVDEFDISESAVKKQSRFLKSILKLDKNFHVYVHGDRQLIEKGYDEEKGKHFYKIYFDEEQ